MKWQEEAREWSAWPYTIRKYSGCSDYDISFERDGTHGLGSKRSLRAAKNVCKKHARERKKNECKECSGTGADRYSHHQRGDCPRCHGTGQRQ